jgi:hypothetical protein
MRAALITSTEFEVLTTGLREPWTATSNARWTALVYPSNGALLHASCTRADPTVVEPGRKRLQDPETGACNVERATGIEPAWSVWKTETLPLSYARNVLSCAPTKAHLSRCSAQITCSATKVRAPARGRAGAGPYTCWLVQNRGVAQLGSALALGARGRGFESRHPDRT